MNNQKGFSVVAGIIVGLVILFAVVAGGVLLFKNQRKTQPVTQDKTADWKTYENKQFGVEFKYPNDWVIGDYIVVNVIPDTNGVMLYFSILKGPYKFLVFQIIQLPSLYISASGEHLCPDESPGLESGLGCPTFTTKKQLTINSRPAKVVDAVGEGGPFRSVEVFYKGKLYTVGQLISGKEEDLIVEDVAKTLIIKDVEPTLGEKIGAWSLYKKIANQEIINDLECKDAALAKEYNTYASRVRNEQSAKELRIFKSLSGIFSINLITTPNYFRWNPDKLNYIRRDCFFEPYVNAPDYAYSDKLVFVLPRCVAGDAPSDSKLRAQQEAESAQCLNFENEIRKILEISISKANNL